MDKNKQNQPQQDDDQANYNPTARNFDQLDVSGEPQPISTETHTDDNTGNEQKGSDTNEPRH